MKLKQGSLGLVLSVMVPACMAGTPATVQYVNDQVAGVQSQIDTINSNPANAHPVGSCYGGGVVFYVNPDTTAPVGQQGLIVALTNANGTTTGSDPLITGCIAGSPVTCRWDTTVGTAVAQTSPLYFTGVANTAAIVGTTTVGTFSAAEAARAYNNYNPPSAITGCTGTTCNWALPSQDELATLYFQSNNMANFWTNASCTGTPLAANAYWSSTQVGAFTAWAVNFGDGFVGGAVTTTTFPVRAVRAF